MSKFKFLLAVFFSGVFLSSSQAVKIGVIVPIQHVAMTEIVAGLKETLAPHLSPTDDVIVQNANGDTMLQQQMIQQMLRTGVDYFLPIGTGVSLMTLSLVKEKPVICVAALVEPAVLAQRKAQGIGAINDEIEVTHLLAFLKKYTPRLKKLGLMYGNSEKIFPEIQEAQNFCQKNGLTLVLRKIDSVMEVHQFAQSLVSEVDAVIILKDLTVVSAINSLISPVYKQGKLLIAMDDGSVKNGAHFGLGVHEKEIGVIAGRSLIEALNGKKEAAFTTKKLQNFSIFYNLKAMAKQKVVLLDTLQEATKNAGYFFDLIEEESCAH